MVSSYLKDLWAEIQKELDDKHPGWKGEIDLFYDHIDCVEENCLNEKEDFEERSEPHANCPPSAGRIARSRGSFRKMPGNAGLLSYRLIFKCFVFGLLSNSTEWSKVMSAIQKPVLSGHFCGYNPTLLQNVPDDYLMNIMYWFIGQGAASSYLRRGLFGLRATAHIFSEAISRCGFLSRYFDCVQGNDHDICLVCRFGTYGGRFNFPVLEFHLPRNP